MVEAPAVQKPPTLRVAAVVLCVIAVVWLIATVAANAAGQPDWATLLGIAAFFFTPVLVIWWLILVILRLVSRRAIGITGWLIVPLVLAAAWLPPWREWQDRRAFRACEPALRALAIEFDSLPVGSDVEVNRTIGSFNVLQVQRYDGCMVLVMLRSPDGEAGMVFSPSGKMPPTPPWAVKHSCDHFEGMWWDYGWWDE